MSTAAERRVNQAVIEAERDGEPNTRTNPALFAPPLPDNSTRSHLAAERAIVHGDWPFVCPCCTDTFQTDRGYFPYCSAICGINAATDR